MSDNIYLQVLPSSNFNPAMEIILLSTLPIDTLNKIADSFRTQLLALGPYLFWSKTMTFAFLGLTVTCGLMLIRDYDNPDTLLLANLTLCALLIVTLVSAERWVSYNCDYSLKNLKLNRVISVIKT